MVISKLIENGYQQTEKMVISNYQCLLSLIDYGEHDPILEKNKYFAEAVRPRTISFPSHNRGSRFIVSKLVGRAQHNVDSRLATLCLRSYV